MSILIDVKAEAHHFVSEVVRFAEGEVGGLFYVEMLEPSYFYISEFVVLEQESSAASVDMEGEAFVAEITRAAKEGKEEQLRGSWHSHDNMSVYYSSTDEQAIKDYKKLQMPWLLSLVYNKAGDIAPRLDIFDSEAVSQLTLESSLEYNIVNEFDQDITLKAKEVVKKLVSKPAAKAWSINNKDKKSDEKSGKTLDQISKSKDDENDEKETSTNGYSHPWAESWPDLGEEMPIGIGYDDLNDPDYVEFMVEIYGVPTVERWIEEAQKEANA